MCSNDHADSMLAVLSRIESRLDSDEYEFSDPYTIGGATGLYQIASPYNTECEWAIISATGLGTFGFVAPTLATEEAPANFNVPASAGPTTLFTGAGFLQQAVVTAVGTTNLTFQDAAGNVIATVVQPGTVGQELPLNAEFVTSLVANNAATTPVVVVSVLKYGAAGTLGTLATSASFVIGSRNFSQPTLSSTGADKFSAFGGKDGNPLSSFVGALTNQAPFITYNPQFMPLQGNVGLFAQVTTPTSTEVLITIQFRRKLEFLIPTIDYRKPHTHTPLSARGARTFMAGFDEALYRVGTPLNPVPAQDPGRFKKAGTNAGEYQAVPRPAAINPMQNLDLQVSGHNLKGRLGEPTPHGTPRERRPRRVS